LLVVGHLHCAIYASEAGRQPGAFSALSLVDVLSFIEIRSPQIGASNQGTREVGATKVGFPENGLAKIGALQRRSMKVHRGKILAGETYPVEIGAR
jgi:hypothetical protein